MDKNSRQNLSFYRFQSHFTTKFSKKKFEFFEKKKQNLMLFFRPGTLWRFFTLVISSWLLMLLREKAAKEFAFFSGWGHLTMKFWNRKYANFSIKYLQLEISLWNGVVPYLSLLRGHYSFEFLLPPSEWNLPHFRTKRG